MEMRASDPIAGHGSPIRRFFEYMVERENVRKRKLAGEPWPWTDDEILSKYKFTNVKREHDKTSQLFLREFYDYHQESPRAQILLNCVIARYFGSIEFMREIGWQKRFYPEYLRQTAMEMRAEGKKVYTGAYIVPSAGRDGPKINYIVDVVLKGIWEKRDKLLKPRFYSWQDFHEELTRFDGFGGSGFMAKEVALDTMFFNKFWPVKPRDLMTWTPTGPGSKKGAAYIMGHPKKTGMRTESTLDVIRKLWYLRTKYLPRDFVPLIMHDIQFCLCEFSKYERSRTLRGRPKAKYYRWTEAQEKMVRARPFGTNPRGHHEGSKDYKNS